MEVSTGWTDDVCYRHIYGWAIVYLLAYFSFRGNCWNADLWLYIGYSTGEHYKKAIQLEVTSKVGQKIQSFFGAMVKFNLDFRIK